MYLQWWAFFSHLSGNGESNGGFGSKNTLHQRQSRHLIVAEYILTLANVNLRQTIMEANHGVLEDECTILLGACSFPRVHLKQNVGQRVSGI